MATKKNPKKDRFTNDDSMNYIKLPTKPKGKKTK